MRVRKKDSVTTGYSGREIAKKAEEQGAVLEPVGSFIGVINERGERVYVQDSSRTLSKQDRERIFALLFAIGFVILVGAACWLWYIPQLQMAGM